MIDPAVVQLAARRELKRDQARAHAEMGKRLAVADEATDKKIGQVGAHIAEGVLGFANGLKAIVESVVEDVDFFKTRTRQAEDRASRASDDASAAGAAAGRAVDLAEEASDVAGRAFDVAVATDRRWSRRSRALDRYARALVGRIPKPKDGEKGETGATGRGIAEATLSRRGYLYVEYDDGEKRRIGCVRGPKGDRGDDGADGASIAQTAVTADGRLAIMLTTGEVLDAGRVAGATGAQGPAGRGISRIWIDENKRLRVEYDDGAQDDAGQIIDLSAAPLLALMSQPMHIALPTLRKMLEAAE